ncbi:hypothetical protein D3Y59_01400 [Hymenobacter oligotrophus]|uniref:N-acetyltransferase domain-containing protein n=1 Tax=Hymenobacter oligotrophus TaxID=2319843 RepID=A0A3B7RNJ7_9BACT|nr:hypothetical protein [Hymenobacter oligotrophus]AYA35817.1 hypothetical protein D3Y59_01400 [Hymenobacter oligotrophus]
MPQLLRIPYQGQLPDWFWQVPARVYQNQPYRPDENPALTEQLFAHEAERNGIVLFGTADAGLRLAGIFPKNSSDAYFGFWETLNDAANNEAAFAALADEARQQGYSRLVGPLNFSTYHAYRLRLGEQPPSWGHFDREPVNPAYYPGLLTALGFQPISTFESRLIRPETVPAVFADKDMLLRELGKIPYDFIPLTPEVWEQHEPEIYELVQAIFGANPAYRPVSLKQFRLLYNRHYAERLCPYTSVLFRDQANGQLAALSFCHPNYQALQLPAHEHPVFERDFAKLPRKVLLAKTVGVHPEYRQRGLMSYMGAYGMVHFRERYEEVIFCLMRTGNYSLHFTDGLDYEVAEYALFGKEL